jgi:hypothetical protein
MQYCIPLPAKITPLPTPVSPGDPVIVFTGRAPVRPVLAAVSRVFVDWRGAWGCTVRHTKEPLGGYFDCREVLPVSALERLSADLESGVTGSTCGESAVVQNGRAGLGDVRGETPAAMVNA